MRISMAPLRSILLPLGAATLLAAAAPVLAATDDVRINQIQVIGTHNSYKTPFAPSARRVILSSPFKTVVSKNDYSHPSLTQQLDDGVRQLEIDVYADTKGGLYADPAIDHMIAVNGLPA